MEKKERKMVLTGRKMTFAEAEEEEIFAWQNTPFAEKWASLDRLRRVFHSMNDLVFPKKMERVIKVVKNGAGR